MARLSNHVLTTEAEHILGLCAHTVRSWARAGKISHHRNPATGYKMFLRKDLKLFLSEAVKPVILQSGRSVDTEGPAE